MAATEIGTVKSGNSKKTYHVKWDEHAKTVYVSYAGYTNIGKASSAGDAMRRAEAWLYDK